MSRKKDLRAQRSQQWMQSALLTLIKEKSYPDISVTEITDLAGVARPTFYLHYKSKDELLLSYLDVLFEQFYQDIDAYLDGTMIEQPVGTKIFEQLQGDVDVIRVILTSGADALLLKRCQQYVMRVFARFLEKKHYGSRNPKVLAFAADYLAGASLAMIVRWIENDLVPSAEVMGHIYYELTQPGLTNVLVQGVLDDVV